MVDTKEYHRKDGIIKTALSHVNRYLVVRRNVVRRNSVRKNFSPNVKPIEFIPILLRIEGDISRRLKAESAGFFK